jgi:hypothetical protein
MTPDRDDTAELVCDVIGSTGGACSCKDCQTQGKPSAALPALCPKMGSALRATRGSLPNRHNAPRADSRLGRICGV